MQYFCSETDRMFFKWCDILIEKIFNFQNTYLIKPLEQLCQDMKNI